jgi:phenylacetate-CoA ligase
MLNRAKALHQVMRDAKLPRSELNKVIDSRLESVLVSAYLHVPYYRGLMQNVGYDPVRDYRGPEDLSILPITSKEALKQGGITAFVKQDSDLSCCFTEATSGSTGIPLRVYRSPDERAVQIAKWLRVLFVNGYSIRNRVMSLTSPTRLGEGRSIIQKFGVLRRLAVSYLLPPQEIVDKFLIYKPDVLYGNRSQLDLMALELKRRGIQYNGLKLLVGTAEVIHDSNRHLYQRQFGVELVETYGSVEMGVMAYETPRRDGLHLCEDLTYFEFLDEEGKPVRPGEPGRVVVTDLTGKLMPFIRYDQGDVAVFGHKDGADDDKPYRLTRIIGRDEDYVLLSDGTQRSFHDFYEVMHNYPEIVQFRIKQPEVDLFQILVVADTVYLSGIRNDLLHRLQKKFPPTVTFEIIQVDQINLDPNGKLKRVVSEVG